MARRDYYDDPTAPPPNAIVPAVTAVVTDGDGHILLVHRADNDCWALPGGGMELGESVSQAVIREVHEETGIDVEITGLVGIYSDPKHIIAYDDGEVRQQFSICFRARSVGGDLRGSSESSEVAWIGTDDQDALSMHPAQRLRVRHGLDGSASTPYIG
jgi:ADP-ribose pyrophosphatase YjhB (NUDIX family)